jgi:hypothetical protein
MFDIPLLDDGYREAFLYLLAQIDRVRFCLNTHMPWYPEDNDKLESALKVYRKWRPDPGNNPILDFPWPNPGEIPKAPGDYLKPTGEEKEKVRAFIKKYEDPDMDSLTEMIVRLAKDLLR